MGRQQSLKVNLNSRLLFYSPLLAGVLFILVLVVHYGVNTPFWDDWEMVPLFQHIGHHTLSFGELWHPHNEHRIFFPLLVLLANAYLTHWHTGSEMLLSIGAAAATATLLFLMLGKSIAGKGLGLAAGVITAVWFFSPVQWQNWLWGGQFVWFACNLAVIASVFLLLKGTDMPAGRQRTLVFGSALASAFIATFSLASGMLAWAVGLALLLATKQAKKPVGLWAGAGLLSIALYYYHYPAVPTPSGSALNVFLHHPLAGLKFFVALMGGPVGSFSGGGLQQAIPGGLQLATMTGGLLLMPLVPLLYIVWQRRRQLGPYLPWLALILYGLLSAAVTSFGRLGYGIDLAFKSRYGSFTLLYVIGISVLTLAILDTTPKLTKRFKQLATISLALFMLPLLISSYAVGFSGFRNQSALLRQVKLCTHVQNPTDACLSLTYPRPWVVRPRLEYVKAKHLAGY